jgi:hypothetical protein
MNYFYYILIPVLIGSLCSAQAAVVQPGDDLQAVLNRGEDLELQKGAVYELPQKLRYKKPGQKIYTKGARYPSEYATLKNVNTNLVTLVDAWSVEGASLEHVICDGNRYELSVRPYPNGEKVHQPGIANFGGGEGQVVRSCVFMNARGFSNIVFHKSKGNQLIENNLVLGAGVDARGNGREANELPFRWSDGISCAAHDSLIRNNIVLDPTDVGIVLYCAPGTVVEENVVASISRESLGGYNLVDAFDHYALDEEKTLFNYNGATVRNNYVDAYGARIHIAIPVGCVPWVAFWKGKTLTGGVVTGNTIAGEAAAYGIVAHGISNWKITDNKSTATYSGLMEYGTPKNPPDDPAPFLFDDESVKECELQPEFQKSVRHLAHLLRTHHAPENELGYRMHDYGDAEVKAVVDAAYLEMLGRAPKKKELEEGIELLSSKELNADGLRRRLMAGNEFQKRYGELPPEELHPFLVKRWFDVFDQLIREHGDMPPAIELYKEALIQLENK